MFPLSTSQGAIMERSVVAVQLLCPTSPPHPVLSVNSNSYRDTLGEMLSLMKGLRCLAALSPSASSPALGTGVNVVLPFRGR